MHDVLLTLSKLRQFYNDGIIESTENSFQRKIFKSINSNALPAFDPAICCNTGVCGADADQQSIPFFADIDWTKTCLVRIKQSTACGGGGRCIRVAPINSC
ncbi:arsenic metallochaperone ArsD family protein [Undibacterium sp.]|uniref:arsenic metallochaperone ArsD family protein n=1 Tax=Undibacterium sp. TaxID=1914977 RepID=UPI0037504686